jgi:hypothetical protein
LREDKASTVCARKTILEDRTSVPGNKEDFLPFGAVALELDFQQSAIVRDALDRDRGEYAHAEWIK